MELITQPRRAYKRKYYNKFETLFSPPPSFRTYLFSLLRLVFLLIASDSPRYVLSSSLVSRRVFFFFLIFTTKHYRRSPATKIRENSNIRQLQEFLLSSTVSVTRVGQVSTHPFRPNLFNDEIWYFFNIFNALTIS